MHPGTPERDSNHRFSLITFHHAHAPTHLADPLYPFTRNIAKRTQSHRPIPQPGKHHLRNEANSVPSAPPSADPQHPPTRNTKRTQFRPQPIANKTHPPPQANPIPSQPYSHATPPSPSPFAHLLYWHFPCSESVSRLPPLVSRTSAAKRWAAKPACAASGRPSES